MSVATFMCGTGKSWANEEIMESWLSKIWGWNNTSRRLLELDAFRAHITPGIKHKARREYNTEMAVILIWIEEARLSITPVSLENHSKYVAYQMCLTALRMNSSSCSRMTMMIVLKDL